jgi:hypothetical protein
MSNFDLSTLDMSAKLSMKSGNSMYSNGFNDDYATHNDETLSGKYGNESISAKFKSSSQKNVARIGSTWSVAIQCFKQSGSVFECIGHLRHICDILDEVDRKDRLKYCKSDYENCVKKLKKSNTMFVSDELLREMTKVSKKYFDEYALRVLPTCIMFEIFGRLGLDEFSVYCSTCKEWNKLASRDEVWRKLYTHRFIRSNPSVGPKLNYDFKDQYKTRMADPENGDKVEVAWRGKFRLEARDVYQGLAWWVAEVVDKHTERGKYKIRYPGWESRWDEWVPRERLRWAVESNTLCKIKQGDVVELWCCGANVPGAWLESRVKKVRDGRFCVNRVLTTGTTSHSRPLWADRSRLRLVRHPHEPNSSNLKDCSSGSEEYMRTNNGPRSRITQVANIVMNFMTGGGNNTMNPQAVAPTNTPTNNNNGNNDEEDTDED